MFVENQLIGPYILIKKLGKGGFGEVWLAEKRTELVTKKVAVKLPLEEQVDLTAIKQEAGVWERASGHPNVLPIIDADIYDGQVVIVSEYAAGGSLDQWLRGNGGRSPSIEKAVEFMLGILSGLMHLHENHITHRDLKPNNILLHGGTPRITDFGVSRLVEESSRGTQAMGTPSYMSPEAFRKSTSPKTDIWSAGVVFYELLSGSLPFVDDDVFALMDAIRTSSPTPLPATVPIYLKDLVETALEKEPSHRFQSAEEMRAALTQFDGYHGASSFVKPGSDRMFLENPTKPLEVSRDSSPTVVRAPGSHRPRWRRVYAIPIVAILIFVGLPLGLSLRWYSQPEPNGVVNRANNANVSTLTTDPHLADNTSAALDQNKTNQVSIGNSDPSRTTVRTGAPASKVAKQDRSQTESRRESTPKTSPRKKVTLDDLIK